MILGKYYYPDKQWINSPHRIEPTGSYDKDPVSGEPVFNGEYAGEIVGHFIQGNREAGKTVGVGIFLIADFLLYGYQFVLLRRYSKNFDAPDNAMSSFIEKAWEYRKEFVYVVEHQPQLQKMYPLDFIRNFDWDNHTLEVKNRIAYIDDKPFAFPGVLYGSGPNDFKEQGPFKNVHKLIYDEFVPEKDAPSIINEVTKFFIIMQTADRGRPDAKKTFACIFMSNNVTDDHEWSKEYDFKSTKKPEDHYFATNKQKCYTLELVKNKAVTEELLESPSGKFMIASPQGQEYFNYSQNNETQDDYNFVEKLKGDMRYLFNIKYENKVYAMKYSTYENMYYFTDEGIDPNYKNSYAVTREDHSLDTVLISRVLRQRMDIIKLWYGNGCMRFGSLAAKNVFMDIYPLL